MFYNLVPFGEQVLNDELAGIIRVSILLDPLLVALVVGNIGVDVVIDEGGGIKLEDCSPVPFIPSLKLTETESFVGLWIAGVAGYRRRFAPSEVLRIGAIQKGKGRSRREGIVPDLLADTKQVISPPDFRDLAASQPIDVDPIIVTCLPVAGMPRSSPSCVPVTV